MTDDEVLKEPLTRGDDGTPIAESPPTPKLDSRLYTAPRISHRFEIEGVASLAEAIRHPVLGRIFEDFHDRLAHSKGKEPTGAEGMEWFSLVFRCLRAGYPILAMPEPRAAAEQVRKVFMDRMAPDYVAVMRKAPSGKFLKYIRTPRLAETIHGSRTLLKSHIEVNKLIVRRFRFIGAGDGQFEDYANLVIERLEDAANRYDENRGAKFATYVDLAIKGAYADWQKSNAETVSLDALVEEMAKRGDGDFNTDDALASFFGVDDSSHYRVRRFPIEWDPEDREQIEFEANLNVIERVVFRNYLDDDPRPWKEIAEMLGKTTANLDVIKYRTRGKLRPVLAGWLPDGHKYFRKKL